MPARYNFLLVNVGLGNVIGKWLLSHFSCHHSALGYCTGPPLQLSHSLSISLSLSVLIAFSLSQSLSPVLFHLLLHPALFAHWAHIGCIWTCAHATVAIHLYLDNLSSRLWVVIGARHTYHRKSEKSFIEWWIVSTISNGRYAKIRLALLHYNGCASAMDLRNEYGRWR